MNLILLGAPGAGKGTQAELLLEKLSIPAISTGNMLREAMAHGTELGKKVKDYMDGGLLVPDELIMGIVADRVAKPDCANGFILDGFPRTIPQAEALDQLGVHIDCVLSLEVSDETIVERMSGRRSCPGCGATYHVKYNPSADGKTCDSCGTELTLRADDKPETVLNRLQVYHTETEPLKDYYAKKNLLKTVVGQASVDDTTRLVKEVLGI